VRFWLRWCTTRYGVLVAKCGSTSTSALAQEAGVDSAHKVGKKINNTSRKVFIVGECITSIALKSNNKSVSIILAFLSGVISHLWPVLLSLDGCLHTITSNEICKSVGRIKSQHCTPELLTLPALLQADTLTVVTHDIVFKIILTDLFIIKFLRV